MNSFRDQHPIKRDDPKAVDHYREYKSDLKQDFNSKCGYCNDSDHWCGGWRFYQIDHFIPRKYLVEISENDYSNLVYSCFFCNNAKRAKWPSKDEKVAIVGNKGFINPRNLEYCDQICRDNDGFIVPTTELGKYMVKALKLNLKRHAIIWKLEKLELLFEQLMVEYDQAKGKIPEDLQKKIIELDFEYHKYKKELEKENDN